MKTLNYKNRLNQSITVEYRELCENEYNNKGKLNRFIANIIVDGKWIAGCIYTPASTEKEIKRVANYYRANRMKRK